MVLLLARTHYSLLTAPASPRALCEEAVRRGHDHLVLADGNALYGLWPFAQETARLGLHGVFGCELVHGEGQGQRHEGYERRERHERRLVAIARDRQGYESLCALLSERHLRADFDLVRAAARHAAGLWFVCRDPALLPALAARLPREALLVGLPPCGAGGGDAAGGRHAANAPAAGRSAGRADAASGPAANAHAAHASVPATTSRKAPDPAPPPPRQQLIAAARDLDLPLCAVRDVWFPRREDHEVHRLFLAVKWNRALRGGAHTDDADIAGDLAGIRTAAPAMHLPERGARHEGFADHPEAIAVAERVLASCTLAFPARAAPVFPRYDVPGGGDPATFLRQLADAGLSRRLPTLPPDSAREAHARLERELAVIERMGFAPYFLVVREIAELARARDIPFVGRGSAADSLVAYALGLTDADPIRYGLLFERFLNPARSDLPDIDLDFCWRRRDELLAAVYRHFGDDHVAMIATYATCGPRAAYAEAAKAAGLPPTEAARRSKLLPWHGRRELDLAAAIAATPGFRRQDVLPQAREAAITAAAQQLLLAPRHLGVHPGGVVITPGPVARHAPLERAVKGVVVAQYDMRFLEALGLVKIDLLGNRALSIVHDCVTSLQRRGVAVPEPAAVAEDEPRTAAMLAGGRTLGCFQVESPAMRTLLQQLQARTMDRVIQAVALIRPGPAAAGMKDAFVARARGLEPVTAAHPLLAEVFADTFGIMLYQEDVIRTAMAVAGMDGTDGDTLRRELGKGQASPAHQDAFVVAGLRRGLPREALERIWREMARFAGYSFCKAHAVTYGRLAFRCVYLKAHWPVAFLCAMLGNDAGYYEKGVYVEEAKRFGARFLPPCVQTGALSFELVDERTIRVGLAEVRGLTTATQERLLAARRAGGPFRSLDDFLQRVRPQRDEAEHLIRVGALDAFAHSRRELLWRLVVATSPRVQAQRERAAAPGALFTDALAPRDVHYPELPPEAAAERTQDELFLLGYALGAHPVDVVHEVARAVPAAVPCGRVDQHEGRAITVCGWLVAWRRHRTENGEPMAFATLEDGTGIVEATLFPKTFQQCGGVFQGRGPYVVRGMVEQRLGGVSLRVLGARELASP